VVLWLAGHAHVLSCLHFLHLVADDVDVHLFVH
jgi:hypothetical protein